MPSSAPSTPQLNESAPEISESVAAGRFTTPPDDATMPTTAEADSFVASEVPDKITSTACELIVVLGYHAHRA